MEPYDLEIGPIQRTFDALFKSIGGYFQSAQVVPEGTVTETDFTGYSQDQLHKSLNASLKYYGFMDLPSSMRIVAEADSQISGYNRSDEIAVYDERVADGSHRTFNFYSRYGPENMKASYFWLNMKRGGEQTQGILTEDERWYLSIITIEDAVYYLRLEKEIQHW